ncbi:MAG: hypothetical protein AAF204_03960 [Pseudomonadota bacterium]
MTSKIKATVKSCTKFSGFDERFSKRNATACALFNEARHNMMLMTGVTSGRFAGLSLRPEGVKSQLQSYFEVASDNALALAEMSEAEGLKAQDRAKIRVLSEGATHRLSRRKAAQILKAHRAELGVHEHSPD